jgi:hypothetical protein
MSQQSQSAIKNSPARMLVNGSLGGCLNFHWKVDYPTTLRFWKLSNPVSESLKRYVVDLDGTLCTNTNGDYSTAAPYVERIKRINELYESGHQIIILTARGMGRFNNNAQEADRAFRSLTEEQLLKWGVRYHSLFLGKPSGDMYIDDKAIKDIDFFGSMD